MAIWVIGRMHGAWTAKATAFIVDPKNPNPKPQIPGELILALWKTWKV